MFDEPVGPEPPFQSFNGYRLFDASVVDDGRRPTFLSSLFRKISQPSPPPPDLVESAAEPEPASLVRGALIEFQASLPAELDIARESFDPFFRNLVFCREPIGFELLGTHKRVLAQFVAGTDDVATVRRQLSAHFPDVQFRQLDGALENAWADSDGDEVLAVDFGLEREFMLPLAAGKMDPFVGLIGALAELLPGELALFKILWQPVQNPWAESIVNSVTLTDGKPLFVNAPELVGAAEEKAAKPLYAAVVRLMGRAASRARLEDITREMAGSFRVFSNPHGNALIPLHNEDYPFEAHVGDVLRRQSRRSGMILNGDELVGFVHLPSSAVRSPVLLRDSGTTKAATPAVRRPPGVVIGDNVHYEAAVPVYLNADQRVRHTHIIGSSGTGKSSLLFNLIRQDIKNGDGLAILDPHGDLIDQILDIIPDDRVDDVVLVNPSDVEFPIGFNILQAHSEAEKNLLASDLVSVFRRLSTSWGDQMHPVLQNAILAFLESSLGGTLADLRRFLLEPAFRTGFLQTVQDPELIYYWERVFPLLAGGKSIGPVLTRLQDFFSRKPLRNMVSQPENKLDFASIMDTGKIFLARLSEGLCGAENSYLLGTLLVSKFQQLAMSRQSQAVSARRNFWLYIDEFDHFISPSMAEILKGARKYRLGLTLAHQELHQLQSDLKVASAVMTHPYTRIVFRVGDDDARKLGEGFLSFDSKSLKTLEKFHAIARVERDDFDFNLAVRKPELPPAVSNKEKVIAASRAHYATPRTVVEAALLAGIRVNVKMTESAAIPGEMVGTKSPARAPAAPQEVPPEIPQVLAAATPAEPPPAVAEVQHAEIPKSPEENPTHTETKEIIGNMAETLDYTVSYEEHFPEIHAKADVVLRRRKRTVVCQVSMTTPPEYEAESVRKFLKSNFTHVPVISLNRRKLLNIQAASGGMGGPKVGFYSREEFIATLQARAMDDPDGGAAERDKPKRRNFDFGIITEPERLQQERELLNKLARAMKSKWRSGHWLIFQKIALLGQIFMDDYRLNIKTYNNGCFKLSPANFRNFHNHKHNGSIQCCRM